MRFTRLLITAHDRYWLDAAIHAFCGYGTSVIACDAEVGLESWVPADETPDQRAGAHVMAFSFSAEALQKATVNRVGQCLMTCPTTAVFNGLHSESTIALGKQLRYFGDGFQRSKVIGETRYWRVPVMDGEFVVEESAGVEKGIAGGNFLIQAVDQVAGLDAARRAVQAIAQVPGSMTPFPGGVVRSGSKVGSRYTGLRASTNEAYCPSLRGRVDSEIVAGANCVYEIVIDAVDFDSTARAMKVGIEAASNDSIMAISAGNYGGNLGKHHFHLRNLWED